MVPRAPSFRRVSAERLPPGKARLRPTTAQLERET